MSDKFSIEHTEHDFFVLKNGERVAKRKTFSDAAACALRMDFQCREDARPGRSVKKLSHRHERRQARQQIREAL